MRRRDPLAPRIRPRCGLGPVVCLVLLLCGVGVAACGAEARDAAIRDLAVGAWACAPSAEGAGEQPFTVRIEDDGTFEVSLDQDWTSDGAGGSVDEISGTWVIEDGDLKWGFDVPSMERVVVPGFDDLTLESTGITLENAGIFEQDRGLDDPEDAGLDDPMGEQHVNVEAHGTDSVTLSLPGGEPWACNRQ